MSETLNRCISKIQTERNGTPPGSRARIAGVLIISLLSSSALTAQTQDAGYALGASPAPVNLRASLPAAVVSPNLKASPGVVDLSPLFPPVGNQGQLGSCVAWSVGYAIKGYQENRERKWGFKDEAHLFSASWVYNQINHGKDNGSSIWDAMTLIKNDGAASYATMPYTLDYLAQPTSSARREAANYPAQSMKTVDLKQTDAVKAILASGDPVAIAINVYKSFMNWKGSGVYSKDSGQLYGGHAMAMIGYDDNKKAYKIQNSWGTNWGDKGYIWIAYAYFEAGGGKDAMVMYDKVGSTPAKPDAPAGLSASLGVYKDQIRVRWDKSDIAEYYNVYRGPKASGPWNLVARVKGANYIDRSVKENAFYYYSVSAVTSLGESAQSQECHGFLAPSQNWVGVPQNLDAEIDGDDLKLSWDLVPGATAYKIFSFDGKENYVQIGQSGDNGYLDKNRATEDGSWYYSITAVKGKTESYMSDCLQVTITTDEDNKNGPVATPPRNLVASQGSFTDRIELSWDPVDKVESYVVQRFNKSANTWDVLGLSTSGGFVDRRAGNTQQFYRVSSVIDGEAGLAGESVTGYTKGGAPIQKISFADAGYQDSLQQDQTNRFKDEDKYTSDTVVTDGKAASNNFVKRDFFFVDVEKFFAVDPNFFKVPDNFFVDPKDFFGNK